MQEYRKKYKLSLRDFGELCDLSCQGVSNIEKKVNPPGEETILKIRKVLDEIIPNAKLVKRSDYADLTGKRFGRLIAIGPSYRRAGAVKKQVLWVCECECGNLTRARTVHLTEGITKSCGCLKSDLLAERNKEGKMNRKGDKNEDISDRETF